MTFFPPTAKRKGVVIQEKPYYANKNLMKFVEEHYHSPQIAFQRTAPKPKYEPQQQYKLRRPTIIHEVRPKIFLAIIFTIQCSFYDITKYIRLFAMYGTLLVLLTFALIYILVIMPLFMVFFFLSNSTRNHFLKIWLAVPILKGVGLSVAIQNFAACVMNMTFVSLCLIYIIGAFMGWLDCGLQVAVDAAGGCLSTYNTSSCTSPGMKMPNVGTYVLLQYLVTSSFGDLINVFFILTIVSMYLLLMFLELYSWKLTTCVSKMVLYAWIMVMLFVIIHEIRFGTMFTVAPLTESDLASLFIPSFYISTGLASFGRVLPGDLVTYGSLTTPGTSPIIMSVLMSVLRVAFAVTAGNFYVISLNYFVDMLDVKNTDCLDISGLAVLYTYIPEKLLAVDPSKAWLLLYLFFSGALGFMSTFFSMNAFLTALGENFPDTKDYRSSIVMFMCGCLCILNTLVVGVGFKNILFEDSKIIIGPLLTSFFVAFFIISYTPLRLANDFYFCHGTLLNTGWVSLMKFYVIFLMSIVIFYLMFEVHNLNENNAVLANVVALVLVMFPVVTFATRHIIKSKKYRLSIFGPSTDWGLQDPGARVQRAAFNARRECRMKMELHCEHECLVAGVLHREELAKEKERFHNLASKYQAKMRQD